MNKRMDRRGWVLLGLVAPALMLAATARADYHPACIGIVTGMDRMEFGVTADDITYSGTVECPGAQRIDIHLALSGPVGDMTAATCADVVACLDPVTASDTIIPADGTYQVVMTFRVEGIGGVLVFDPVPRCGVWIVAGTTAEGPLPCPEAG